MFSLFKNLPEEIILAVFNQTSRSDQAELAQVNKDFNRLANDHSLKLFKYKLRCKTHQVGDVCLVIKKDKPNSSKPYTLYLIKNGEKVFNVEKALSDVRFNVLAKKMEERTEPLINELKAWSLVDGKYMEFAQTLERNLRHLPPDMTTAAEALIKVHEGQKTWIAAVSEMAKLLQQALEESQAAKLTLK